MAALPGDIKAMGCGLHQFWMDRVRECQDAGILREGDPLQLSLTMWAHAHGLLSLYHHGHFRMDAQAFRTQFKASSRVMMRGLATDDFMDALADRIEESLTGAATGD
jgi:hypothetical protein